MSDRVRALPPQLAELTDNEKALLINILSDEDEDLTREEWEAGWVMEINRRIADYDAGTIRPIPGDDFMNELKEKYG